MKTITKKEITEQFGVSVASISKHMIKNPETFLVIKKEGKIKHYGAVKVKQYFKEVAKAAKSKVKPVPMPKPKPKLKLVKSKPKTTKSNVLEFNFEVGYMHFGKDMLINGSGKSGTFMIVSYKDIIGVTHDETERAVTIVTANDIATGFIYSEEQASVAMEVITEIKKRVW